MTYSIVARDPGAGLLGVATQSQAFAVGTSVPWAEPGHGLIATQSVAELFYGELGISLMRGGLTAAGPRCAHEHRSPPGPAPAGHRSHDTP